LIVRRHRFEVLLRRLVPGLRVNVLLRRLRVVVVAEVLVRAVVLRLRDPGRRIGVVEGPGRPGLVGLATEGVRGVVVVPLGPAARVGRPAGPDG
jgi:hypothetical protein